MTIVYNAYGLKAVNSFETREEAIEWMRNLAASWNYGIYRTWTLNGLEYFDLGPRVYCLLAEEIMDKGNKVC